MKRVNPDGLLRQFIVVSVVGVAALMLFASWGVSQVLHSYNTKSAERNAISIGYSLYRLEQDVLINPETRRLNPRIPEAAFHGFDGRMRALLSTMGIIKIKIFSHDEAIIYSTDHNIIGVVDRNNSKLIRSLKGEVVSELESKESVADLEHETRFDIDVVESYLPLYDDKGQVQGAYEVYVDITPYRDATALSIKLLVAGAAILLLLIFTILGVIMYRGSRELNLAYRQLIDMASHDSLTGLYNRGYLDSRMDEAFARVQRSRRSKDPYSVGVVMVDLDHFKQVNDEQGHLVGDELLVAVAARLRNTVRNEDVVGRYGGEEFLIILPALDEEQSHAFSKRIWAAIRQTPFRIDGTGHRITASLGISIIKQDDSSKVDALDRADTALYRAKERGRDRIER